MKLLEQFSVVILNNNLKAIFLLESLFLFELTKLLHFSRNYYYKDILDLR